MDPRVSIQIVVRNEKELLVQLLDSLRGQRDSEQVSIRVIDNASTDGVVPLLRDLYPEVMLIRHTRPISWAAAQNQGIRYAVQKWEGKDLTNRYIVCIDPAMILSSGCLSSLIEVADAFPGVGSFGGTYRRAYGTDLGDDMPPDITFSDQIHSTGMGFSRDIVWTNRGADQMEEQPPLVDQEIFGVNPCLVLYRTSVLLSVGRDQKEWFDERLPRTIAEMDMACRFQRDGWPTRFVPQAQAHYYIGSKPTPKKKDPTRGIFESCFLALTYFSCLENIRLFPFFVRRICPFAFFHPRLFFGVCLDVVRLYPHMHKLRRFQKSFRQRSLRRLPAFFL